MLYGIWNGTKEARRSQLSDFLRKIKIKTI
jgi:hypothetical protein